MKIEVWSDFVCPFCYIGKRRLEEALATLPENYPVEIEFRSFELDPNVPKDETKPVHEALAEKYNVSVEEAKRMNENVGKHAESVGLTYNFDKMLSVNTFDAHRLAHFAKSKGVDLELTEKLFYAYFTEGKKLSDINVLADIAESVGLNREEVVDVLLNDQAFVNEVRYDQMLAQQIGIRGVPFFVLNQKYAISGAQPLETFVGALNKVMEEEQTSPILQDLSGDGEDAACIDGNCAIPDKKE